MLFLHKALNRFSPNTATATLEPTPATTELTRQADDYAALIELQKTRQVLEVISTYRRYQSIILDFNITQGLLLLDDLFPTSPEHPIRIGDRLTIKHYCRDQVLSFTSSLLNIDNTEQTPAYLLTLPHNVRYKQRRLSQRLRLNRHKPLTVKLHSPQQKPWFATAGDLSATGIGLTMANNVTGQLYPGAVLPSLEFQFNQNFYINCQAHIRRSRFSRRPYHHTQIGIEFIDIAPYQRLQLQQFVNAMLASAAQAA